VWLNAWPTLLGALDQEGLLKWDEVFIDGSFASAKNRRYEDGRKLRRYKRRWIMERINAWLGQFRRLLVRHEYTYRSFFYVACFWITLRRCF
jgi:transposase